MLNWTGEDYTSPGSANGGNPCLWQNNAEQTDMTLYGDEHTYQWQSQNSPYYSMFSCTVQQDPQAPILGSVSAGTAVRLLDLTGTIEEYNGQYGTVVDNNTATSPGNFNSFVVTLVSGTNVSVARENLGEPHDGSCSACPAAVNTGTYALGSTCAGQETISNSYMAAVNIDGVAPEDYGKAEALEAAEMYTHFLTALSRYDCDSSFTPATAYAAWNCEDCRKAYAAWLCSQYLVKCTPFDGDPAQCDEVKPCISVCNEVVRKCPVSIGFGCPDYEGDYSLANDDECNNMAIAGAQAVSQWNAALSLLSVGIAFYVAMSSGID